MPRFCGSDIALFQHRDVFADFQKAIAYWPADRSYGVQQLLDEALWKGDFAFCLPVKGSTLKKMLKDSAHFDQQDRDSLSLETEKGRGLISVLSLRRQARISRRSAASRLTTTSSMAWPSRIILHSATPATPNSRRKPCCRESASHPWELCTG